MPKGPGANPALAALAGNDNISIKPTVKQIVSKELILFFDKIRSAILDDNGDQDVETLRKSAFESVRSDPGLQQLVPYFIQFVAEKVTHCLDNLFVLQQMMALDEALIENPTLFVDPYVANLVPPIITCLLGRKLGRDGVDNLEAQYDLRDTAASLIGQIVAKYHKSNQELQARITRTCLKYFLDPDRTPGEHYGAIEGIRTSGGAPAILQLVIPNLKAYEAIITKHQNERGETDETVKLLVTGITRAISSITDIESSAERTNGVNGNAAEASQLEEYLGSLFGNRVVGLGNHKLNRIILESREKE